MLNPKLSVLSLVCAWLCFATRVFSVTSSSAASTQIPVIDISLLLQTAQIKDITNDYEGFCRDIKSVSEEIDYACRNVGFFYIKNHNVPESLQEELVSISKSFFNQSPEEKYKIAMSKGGKAWRGYFGVGDEVTSGIPDQKEGIYFGTEIKTNDPRPLHGQNQWPENELGESMEMIVLTYMNEMKNLGRLLMNAIACNLQVQDAFFLDQLNHPTELFRIFNYPPHNPDKFPTNSLGVGEHTDYGYLTILRQDTSGGLQVRSLKEHDVWLQAPPIENTFVINLGDALEHNTKGLYRATPHRVLQRVGATEGRISMPYFFDPSFDSSMKSMVNIENIPRSNDVLHSRWDKMDPTLFEGTYGQYLLKKVSKAFPELFQQFVEVLATGESSP